MNKFINKNLLIIILTILSIVGFGLYKWSNRTTDNVNYSFVNEPRILGIWKSIDFISKAENYEYDPEKPILQLFLREISFYPKGKLVIKTNNPRTDSKDNSDGRIHWTKGMVLNKNMSTASSYQIKEINGESYLFLQWKNGDYIYGHQKPKYYVLKRF